MKKFWFSLMVLSMLFVVLPVFAEDEEEPEVYCENEAGHCTISRWGYKCFCRTVDGFAEANGGGGIHGDYEVSEEVCKSDLESNCGTEIPTVRSKCGKKFDFCVTFVSESSRCTDNYMTEDEVIAAVDSEDFWNDTKRAVYIGCCGAYSSAQSKLECLQEQCGEEFTDECCAECYINDTADTADPGDTDIPDTAAADTGDSGDTEVISPAPEDDTADSSETDEVDTANTEADDTANTEAPKDGSAPAEDTTDGDKQEESKTDGCLMLFV